jgi:hypothetical protein
MYRRARLVDYVLADKPVVTLLDQAEEGATPGRLRGRGHIRIIRC